MQVIMYSRKVLRNSLLRTFDKSMRYMTLGDHDAFFIVGAVDRALVEGGNEICNAK
jgi:hypothetical protein